MSTSAFLYFYRQLSYVSAILDGRLGFSLVEGVAVALVFAVEERLKRFAKLQFPNLPEIKTKAAELTHSTIGFNITFG